MCKICLLDSLLIAFVLASPAADVLYPRMPQVEGPRGQHHVVAPRPPGRAGPTRRYVTAYLDDADCSIWIDSPNDGACITCITSLNLFF